MSKENIKKKGISWFKSNNYSQDQLVENNSEQQAAKEEQLLNIEKHEQANAQKDSYLFSKDNQDKVVLDLMVSLENIVKDRQLILYKNKGLEEQLFTANETISRIKQDLIKKEQLLQGSNKEILRLEDILTNKQMSYDQLLEDYKEYQDSSNAEYEQISNQLEIEINKYNKLNEESKNTQYKNMLRINELEEVIRSLEIENQRYEQQYQQILNEKSELMQTINDFTARMSFSFSPKPSTSNSTDSK